MQRPAITKHLKNIIESGELDEKSVSSILELTAADGKTYKTKFYNLDAIISVGYRANSRQATQFRIWATKVLKEYILKGFAMDDERLKNGRFFGQDYFKELLERVRSIQSFLGLKHREHFRNDILNPLIIRGKLELTIPDKPKSPNQRYIVEWPGSS